MADNETIYVEPIIVDEGDVIIESLVVSEEVSTTFRIGVDGVTFIPNIVEVSPEETILSFTNNGGLDNPSPTNIKGTTGLDAYKFWLLTHEGTVIDYENWLKQPATDAAASIGELEDEIESAEALRVLAEQSRVVAEIIRQDNEDDRVLAEQGRVSAEETREENEAIRQLNTSTAISNAEDATDYALETATHPTYIESDYYVVEWNHETQSYNKTTKYVKGDKGDAFTYEDFTAEQIEALQQPATDAAEIVGGLIDELQQLESTVEANEEVRQSNEVYREEIFAENLDNVNNALSDLNDLKGELNTSLDTISDYTDAANLAAIAANNAADSATQATIYANDAGDYANEQGAYAQEIAEHPTYIGVDYYVYRWNHTTQAYDKTTIYTKGEAFSVKKTYSSIAEMNADYSGTDVKIGEFVLVVSNVEDPDNAKLYVKTNVQYDFVVDMSGAIGFTGQTPQFSIGNVITGAAGSSAAVTISENGYDDNGNPKFLLNFAIPKGDKGDTGDTGVYIGTEEPTDPVKNVWVDPNGQGIELYSDQYTTTLLKIVDSSTILTTGDLQGDFMSLIAGDITSVAAWVTTASTSGIVTIQIRNLTTGNDILSTKLTIDATETKSLTAATPYVINTSYKGVSVGDIIVVDIDIAGTGTKGLSVAITISESLV